MRFPKVVTHRKAQVTIYRRSKAYDFYRLVYRVDGKRRMKSYSTYSEAKKAADELVKELYKGSPVAALNAAQARDAISALERLQTLFASTGRRVSLLGAVSEFCDSVIKLPGRSLSEVVEAFLSTVAVIKRKGVAEAVEEFIEVRKPLTLAKPGKRAQLSSGYAYLVGSWLRRFAKAFPGTAVCELGKDHLNLFLGAHDEHSAKSRNHLRGTLKMFLTWCAKRDYLSQTHRLFEADSMATEAADTREIDYYRPKELQGMLDSAQVNKDFKALLPVIALCGLAGLRLEEALRLDWADVWRVAGHVEIKALKAKTRARRLVEMNSSLAGWLAPYRAFTGPVYSKSSDTYHETLAPLREELKIPIRKNGLRHAFCSYHFALHSNENLTAALAGNSPAMIHAHYKGLATKAEAEKWFNVRPLGGGGERGGHPHQAGG